MGSDEPPTEELIEAARAGDLEAWNRLDERSRETLALFLRGRIPTAARRRFDTEDMLQSALLSAFDQLDSFEYRGEGSFERWIRKLVLNRLNGKLRQQYAGKRDVRLDEELSDAAPRHPQQHEPESPSQVYSRAEGAARLLQCIAELPRAERDVIKMVVFDRRPLERIAQDLELSVRQVRHHRRRALEAIRRRMKDWSEEKP